MNKEKLKRRSQFIAVLSRYFNDYLPSRRSEKTITHYRVVMTGFLKHIAGRGAMRLDELSFEDITRDSVEGFIRVLHEDEKLSASTCNNYLSVIRAFMKYASVLVNKSRQKRYLFSSCIFRSLHKRCFSPSCFFKSRQGLFH